MRVEIVGIDKRNPLELSEAVDKLRSSGTYTGNQIRVMLGDEPGDDPHLDEYVLTKTTKLFQMKEVMLKMSSPIVRNVTPVLETKLRMISIS